MTGYVKAGGNVAQEKFLIISDGHLGRELGGILQNYVDSCYMIQKTHLLAFFVCI